MSRAPLSGVGWRATVLRDANGWASNTVRLLVADVGPARFAVFMQDGTWVAVPEGQQVPDSAGIVLPAGAIEAIAAALAEYQGHTSHADTEARVLREWLAVERSRVDKALDR